MYDVLLERAHSRAMEFLTTLPTRPVAPPAADAALHAALDVPLGGPGEDPAAVIDHLATAAEPGLVASAGPRYFGFVTGGSLPVAVAADWLVSAWDQNVAMYVMSPAGAAIEAVTARWILDLLGLPPQASVGFTTGAHTANLTALAAARHAVLSRAGWDVERDGLSGAPPVHVLVGEEAHVSILAALRLLGVGSARVHRVAADDQGRMRPEALAAALAHLTGPLIVCAQAGHVSTGAFDPLPAIVPLVRRAGGWLHVDGAFGLWAAASPAYAHLAAGVEGADSWTTDAHKWLNVPYDCGVVACAHPQAHRAAVSLTADYLHRGGDDQRNGMDWTPESSRRARAVPVYAALRTLGRDGVAALVARCCGHARRMAARLGAEPGLEILNEVVLNQVLVRAPHGAAMLARLQADGVCWLGGTTWQGEGALRISVSGWNTTEADIDASAASIVRAHRAAGGGAMAR